MMKHSNQQHDYIATVQLSPFGEDHWNRMVTYSPNYVNWADFTIMTNKHPPKQILRKRSLISPIDMKTVKLEDQVLINELELLKEKYYIAKQNLEKSMRDGTVLKEELTKAVYARDSLEKETVRLNGKVNELAAGKKAADEKVDFLNGRTNNLQVDLRR